MIPSFSKGFCDDHSREAEYSARDIKRKKGPVLLVWCRKPKKEGTRAMSSFVGKIGCVLTLSTPGSFSKQTLNQETFAFVHGSLVRQASSGSINSWCPRTMLKHNGTINLVVLSIHPNLCNDSLNVTHEYTDRHTLACQAIVTYSSAAV